MTHQVPLQGVCFGGGGGYRIAGTPVGLAVHTPLHGLIPTYKYLHRKQVIWSKSKLTLGHYYSVVPKATNGTRPKGFCEEIQNYMRLKSQNISNCNCKLNFPHTNFISPHHMETFTLQYFFKTVNVI